METKRGGVISLLSSHNISDNLSEIGVEYVEDYSFAYNGEVQNFSGNITIDGDSPQQKVTLNGYHQDPDFAYSPNPHSEYSGSDKNNSESEPKPKVIPQKEAPPPRATLVSTLAHQNRQREQQQKDVDSEKLASARKRLQENYKEAENAKRQRTIQVMDIHEIPKPKNAFFGKNKGGSVGGSHGRH
ncbi:hypothetical protein SO802_012116 [Lithocarpus litseifolius]|uniref:Uncharacterized protein n=1 Tax=Lithocarpus litseifolius TaxID=425828 RepID=A0AAW2D5X8_9ROSI